MVVAVGDVIRTKQYVRLNYRCPVSVSVSAVESHWETFWSPDSIF